MPKITYTKKQMYTLNTPQCQQLPARAYLEELGIASSPPTLFKPKLAGCKPCDAKFFNKDDVQPGGSPMAVC